MQEKNEFWEIYQESMCESWTFHVFAQRFEIIIENTKIKLVERHRFTDIETMRIFIKGRFDPMKISGIGQHKHFKDSDFDYRKIIDR
jgi:hypothetical protein